MKKNLIILCSSALLSMSLAACGGDTKPLVSSDDSSGSSGSSVPAADLTNKDLPLAATTFVDAKGTKRNLTRDTLYRNSGNPHVNSNPDADASGKVTKPRLLVAPIRFNKDAADAKDTVASHGEQGQQLLKKITTTFAGTDEETKKVGGHKSVQSFYHDSSFGKAGFDVYVLPTWVDANMTPKEADAKWKGGVGASQYVRQWYLDEYAKENHGLLGEAAEPLTAFDTDHDGYIDLTWNVYAYPYQENKTNWWAYVTYAATQPNLDQPSVKTLAWASTAFMSGYNGYDSHTFIHETGHTLGLDDYYDYNGAWAPMGGVDYMDHNLGDHNAFSKFQYGWVKPWVLKEEDLAGGKTAEITLRASALSGDCLVLASPDYNNTAFDEYLMLELVGPYGLCKDDYLNGYSGTNGFTVPGVRVLHVDGRAQAGEHYGPAFQSADEVGQKGYDIRIANSHLGRQGLDADGDYFPIETSTQATQESAEKSSLYQCGVIEATVEPGNTNLTSSTYNVSNKSLFTANKRLSFTPTSTWARNYMPSRTNLWNKAKTKVGGSADRQRYTIDKNCTINYSMRVKSIVEDPTYGAIATLAITVNK